MNLRDEFLPWKYIIGQVILDVSLKFNNFGCKTCMLIILINHFVTLKKIPNVLTVVNKTDIIDSTYRFFKMEILAGENNMIAEVVCLE